MTISNLSLRSGSLGWPEQLLYLHLSKRNGRLALIAMSEKSLKNLSRTKFGAELLAYSLTATIQLRTVYA